MKLDKIFELELAAALIIGAIGTLSYCSEAEALEVDHTIYVGAGYHQEKWDCPEVCYGHDELVLFEYTAEFVDTYTAFKIMHISSPMVTEQGYGFNAVFYGLHYKW